MCSEYVSSYHIDPLYMGSRRSRGDLLNIDFVRCSQVSKSETEIIDSSETTPVCSPQRVLQLSAVSQKMAHTSTRTTTLKIAVGPNLGLHVMGVLYLAKSSPTSECSSAEVLGPFVVRLQSSVPMWAEFVTTRHVREFCSLKVFQKLNVYACTSTVANVHLNLKLSDF